MKKNYFEYKNYWTLVLLLVSFLSFGQTNTWNGSSNNNWNTPANWSLNLVPTAAHDVVIPNVTQPPTITAGTTAICNNIVINPSATLTLANSATALLNINGNFTNNGTFTAAGTGTTNVNIVSFIGTSNATIGGTSTTTFRSLTINKNTAIATVINSARAFSVANNLTITQGNLVLTAIDADYTVGNNVTVAAAGTLTHNVAWNRMPNPTLLRVSGNLDIAGIYSYSGAYLTTGVGTDAPRAHIQMNGVGKTIRTGTTALSILTLMNTSGTISANGTVTINDNFWSSYNTIGGTFATAGNIVTANGAVLNAGGTLSINGGTLNVSGGLYNTYSGGFNGIVNLSSGTLNADALYIGNGTGTPINTGTDQGTFNHSGGIANIGNLVIGGGTAVNVYTCSGTPTINISGSWTNNRTFTAANSTVNFIGTSAQTINGNLSGTGTNGGRFFNLTFNGVGGNWTNNSPMEVSNTLTMTNGILTTSAANLLNVTRNAINAITGGSTTSFISGPVNWTTSLNGTYNFPVGKGNTYLPFILRTGGVVATPSQIEAFDYDCGGEANFSSIGTLSTSEYWSLVTSGNFNNSSISISRPTPIAPLSIIGGSTTQTGVYTSLGGTVGTNGITNSLAIGSNRFFAFGRHEIRTSTISGSPFCAGSTVSIPFTIAGTYNSGNIFTAQLSNASGSFASPVNIGTLTQITAGTISATIPIGTTAGTGYRIRVVSSNPSVIGTNNNSDLTVNNTTAPTGTASQSFCSGTTVASLTATGTAIKWYSNASGGTALLSTTPLINGTYYASQTISGCESTARLALTVTLTSYSLNSVSATNACEIGKQSTVTLTSTAANLPVGNYVVTYKIDNSDPPYTATMNVTTAGTGSFIADVSTINYEAQTSITITRISNSTCFTNMTVNSNQFRVVGVRKPVVSNNSSFQCDRKRIVRWTPVNYADGYYLDVATDANFTNFIPNYQNKYIAGGSVQNETIENLAYGGTYYYRVRAQNNLCGISPNSDVISFDIMGDGSSTPGTIGGGTSSICVGNTTTFTKDPNTWPATGTWSIFNQTGSATITQGGVVTGVSSGTVFVVFTTQNGGCGTSSRRTLTITGAGTVSNASSAPVLCANSVMTNITHTTSGFTGISNNGVSGENGLPAGVSASFSGNTITISGTPNVSGTFNYSIPLTGACGSVNATGTITVTAVPNATISYSGSPYCKSITAVQGVTQTGTSGGNYTVFPSGLTINAGTGAVTPSTSTAGTYVVTYTYGSGSCTGLTATASVTISDITVAPTVGVITQPTCSTTTGSVVLNGLPNSWMLTRTPGNITTTGTGNSTTISGLATGTYTYTVTDLSKGLRGEYFNNTDLSGTPALTRTDPMVNFDFGNGSPDPSIGADNFSVRWSGFVEPLHSETYTFSTNSDDGIRLWVNGVQIINNWTDHGPIIDQSTPIALTAGTKYKIVLEYYERGGGAVAQLSWRSANQTSEIIPQTQLDPPTTCTSVASANVVINPVPAPPTSPVVGTVTQPTCATATGSVVLNSLPAGSWMLTRAPGNVKTAGAGASTTISGLATGTYTYTVNNLINGLKAEYFNNTDLSGTPALTRTDATVGFDFSNGSPDPSIGADNFSARWSGFVQPTHSENYTFSTNSDDGIRLWVNGVQVINNWTDHAPTIDQSIPIALTAGTKYEIVLEYYERGGGAVAQLSWSSANQALQIIPQPQLFSVGVGDCSSVASANVVINAQPGIPSAPIVGTRTQPNCSVLTGSVDLSGLPASGDWILTRSPGNVTTTGTGPEATVLGLTANTTYTFTVTVVGGCTSVPSSDVVINANPYTVVTWNGSDWLPSNPTINNRVEFNADYSSGNNTIIEACSCYINSNAKITFNTGATLKVVNEVVVNTGTGITAALTFENNASLVQVNDAAVNSGSITYNRDTHVYRYDYTYWSSPVKGMTLNNLSPNTLFDRYFSYNNAWVTIRSGNAPMDPGHGYIIRGPQPYPTGPTATEPTARLFTGIFTGVPNNGVINGNDLAVLPNRDYLLGNPYPSAIDADEFLKQNSTRLQGTLYFWTHNTAPAATTGTTTYKYVASDYASYNRTGGVGVGKAADSDDNVIKKIPTGKIAVGQGFFARAIAAPVGNVVFNNSMRLGATATTYLDNSQFFKVSTNAKTTTATATTTEKNRVWLNLTNAEGAFKQTLIGYITGATNDYDNGFDGVSYNGNQYVDFYSVNSDKNLVIQGRALPFVKKDSVALGYNTTIKGDFKISIDQLDGIFTTQNVFLEDKELKVQHDLKKEAYTFSTEKGTFNNRFVLRYVDKNAVDEVIIPEIPGENANVVVSVKDAEIKINSTVAKLDKVVVYNVAGRMLFQKNKIDANVLVIPHLVWNHQVLLVDIVLSDGTKHSRKIIN